MRLHVVLRLKYVAEWKLSGKWEAVDEPPLERGLVPRVRGRGVRCWRRRPWSRESLGPRPQQQAAGEIGGSHVVGVHRGGGDNGWDVAGCTENPENYNALASRPRKNLRAKKRAGPCTR